jgi:hypothetical protein
MHPVLLLSLGAVVNMDCKVSDHRRLCAEEGNVCLSVVGAAVNTVCVCGGGNTKPLSGIRQHASPALTIKKAACW